MVVGACSRLVSRCGFCYGITRGGGAARAEEVQSQLFDDVTILGVEVAPQTLHLMRSCQSYSVFQPRFIQHLIYVIEAISQVWCILSALLLHRALTVRSPVHVIHGYLTHAPCLEGRMGSARYKHSCRATSAEEFEREVEVDAAVWENSFDGFGCQLMAVSLGLDLGAVWQLIQRGLMGR